MKVSLLKKGPREAVNILLSDPAVVVVALPDLYSANKGFKHETAGELIGGLQKSFEEALRAKTGVADPRLQGRFKAFCFKYEMEVLLLAAEEVLLACVRSRQPGVDWRKPVCQIHLRIECSRIRTLTAEQFAGLVEGGFVPEQVRGQCVAEQVSCLSGGSSGSGEFSVPLPPNTVVL